MTSEEKRISATIERKLKEAAEQEEISKLIACISQGKTVNPFFASNPQAMQKPLVPKCMQVLEIARLPNSSDFHVGFSYRDCLVDKPVINLPVKPTGSCSVLSQDNLRLYTQFKPVMDFSQESQLVSHQASYTKAQVIDLLDLDCDEPRGIHKKLYETFVDSNFQISVSKESLWTDLYCPNSCGELLGSTNRAQIRNLLKWLKEWSVCKRVAKRSSKYSDDEFSDEDDEPRAVACIQGPRGCGKSCAVYSCAKEAGFTVLEVSCSQKRSGKELLAIVGEACSSKRIVNQDSDETSVKTVILIDDIDVLLGEDKGFWSALAQLMQTSRSPILLTTTQGVFTPSNPHLNSCLTWIDRLDFFEMVIPKSWKSFIRLIGCLHGVWFQDCLLKSICHSGTIGGSLLQAQLEARQVIPSVGVWKTLKTVTLAKTKKSQTTNYDMDAIAKLARFAADCDLFERFLPNSHPTTTTDELMLPWTVLEESEESNTAVNLMVEQSLPHFKSFPPLVMHDVVEMLKTCCPLAYHQMQEGMYSEYLGYLRVMLQNDTGVVESKRSKRSKYCLLT